MRKGLELVRSLLPFSLNLRLWSDVVAVDPTVRDTQIGRGAQAQLKNLASAVSNAAHQFAAVEAVDGFIANEILSYADSAELIAATLPDGPHRSAVRDMARQFRAEIQKQLPVSPAYV